MWLLCPSGSLDTLFPYLGSAAAQYQTELYTSGAGAIQANYFYANLKSCGLYKSEFGPRLKHFPFFEDAAVIYSELKKFMTTFVQSYYHSGSDTAIDTELQTWITEAVPAWIIDFPPAPLTKCFTLIDMLTHLAYFATVVHITLNTNESVTSTTMLPFHPASLYSPIPTSKGVTDLLPFLPHPNNQLLKSRF
jgi:arachidonate 15-lipoxygenase (second type) / 8-lipoxygenase (S-type)